MGVDILQVFLSLESVPFLKKYFIYGVECLGDGLSKRKQRGDENRFLASSQHDPDDEDAPFLQRPWIHNLYRWRVASTSKIRSRQALGTSETRLLLPWQNTASRMGLGLRPSPSLRRTVFCRFQNWQKGESTDQLLIIAPPLHATLALMLDTQQRGRRCHCLFSRLAACSQGLSVSYFAGAGPDQYCILSDLSKPSGEGNHPSVAPCSFWNRSIPRQRGALFLLQL